MDNTIYNGLGIMSAAQALQKGVVLTGDGSRTSNSDFQKLLDQKSESAKDTAPEEKPKGKDNVSKPKKTTAAKQEEKPAGTEEEQTLKVYLAPLTPEELSQYPAEWLPVVQEGEAIVCLGVTTDENGQQMPILMGANEAYRRYGFETAGPELLEQPQGEIEIPEELIQAPEQMEQAVMEEDAPAMEQFVQEAQPQEKDDAKVEVTDVEQAPHRIFHDVEAAPIKVGEVYNAEQADGADVVNQVETQIAQALQQGESTVQVRLNPENLGEVTVQISMKSDGVLSVAINARNDDTRALLERHAGQLQELLSSRVRESVQVEVQRQQESQQGQDQHPYDGHNGHSQGGQEQRRPRREHTSSQDFIQQLRLGLIPMDEA